MLFFVNFFALGYVGMLPAEGLYLLIARIGLVYYFGFFIIITPLVGWIEKPKTLPLSISDVYLGGGKEALVPVSEKEIH
jgi:ubiquinol-cytochrome c reductase cytochrome b subunit